jgi:hypothetical protein
MKQDKKYIALPSAFGLALSHQYDHKIKYSSKALDNGTDAVGSKWIRPGFAWNTEMDMAWALGFPEMAFLAEGPKEYDQPEYWKSLSIRSQEKVISPAMLMANVYETYTGQDPKILDDAAFSKITKLKKFSREDIKALFCKAIENQYSKNLPSLSIWQIELLCGPDLLVEIVISYLETSEKKTSHAINSLLKNLLVLFKRIHQRNKVDFLKRIASLHFENRYDQELQKAILDPLLLGENYPPHQSSPCAFRTQYLDGYPEYTMKAAEAGRIFGYTAVAYRTLFTGSKDIFTVFVKKHQGIHRLTRNEAYFSIITSIKNHKLLPAFLRVAAETKYTDSMHLWFRAHASFFIPELQKIGSKQGLYQDAANDMLVLLGQTPAAPLVPTELQKSLNPPDEWKRSFIELDKLTGRIKKYWGDDKSIKKEFRKTYSKITGFAAKAEHAPPESFFSEVWSTFEAPGLSTEQTQYLNQLYQKIISEQIEEDNS